MSSIQRFGVESRYSQAVVHGGVVYLSGQVGLSCGTFQQQCEEAFNCVDQQLEAAGSHKSRLLSLQIFLRSPQMYAAMNAVYDHWLRPGSASASGSAPPARNTICGVQFPNPLWQIEVVAVAALNAS
jgi:enamine deaminase RidA (YjgF/YER057c/UK114 family)